MTRLIIRAYLGAAAMLGGAGVCAQQLPARTADAQRMPAWTQSLVKIFVRCNANNAPWTGTGIVTTPGGKVLTASHVGSACIGANDTTVRIGFVASPYAEPAETFEATLIGRRADGKTAPTTAEANGATREDIAAYQIANPANVVFPAVPISALRPLPGDGVWVGAFSNATYGGLTGLGFAGATIFSSAIFNIAGDAAGAPVRLHYGANTMLGASGGPVVNAAGELIGVHSARRDQGPGDLLTAYSWATPASRVPAAWLAD